MKLMKIQMILIEKFTNQTIKKMTDNLENFHYNVIIANFHEIYNFLQKTIKKLILSHQTLL